MARPMPCVAPVITALFPRSMLQIWPLPAMIAVPNIAVSWSSGKDAALALARLLAAGAPVSHLLTTVSAATDRVVMHGVRPELLRAQAAATGLPLWEVPLPAAPDNSAYDAAMTAAFAGLKAAGVTTVAYGDIFLEDLRAYREQQAAEAGLEAIFPLWGAPTMALVDELIRTGIDARTVCVDDHLLPLSFLGRKIDAAFAAGLPAGVDPCGERGEYHSFVLAAPYFRAPIRVQPGAVVQRSYPAPDGETARVFSFLDLTLAED